MKIDIYYNDTGLQGKISAVTLADGLKIDGTRYYYAPMPSYASEDNLILLPICTANQWTNSFALFAPTEDLSHMAAETEKASAGAFLQQIKQDAAEHGLDGLPIDIRRPAAIFVDGSRIEERTDGGGE